MAVKGLNETLGMLDKMEFDIKEDLRYEIEKGTETIFREARQLLNAGGNELKTKRGFQHTNTNIDQFLNYEILNDGFTGSVFIPDSASVLAVYLEFGTGSSAASYVPQLPPEMQLIALSYYINGKGSLQKRPFLIPAFFNNQGKIALAIKAAFEKRGLKVNVLH